MRSRRTGTSVSILGVDGGNGLAFEGERRLARAGALVVFGLIMWRVAIHAMTRKLID